MKVAGWEGKLIPKALIISELFPEEKKAMDDLVDFVVETDSRLMSLVEESAEDSVLSDVAEGGKVKSKLAKNVDHPEENEDYPESVRYSKAMQALYDNVGGDEVLAIELHKAVMNSKMSGFRGDSIKERRIKRALFAILNDDAEVERLYKIIEKQEEY